MDILSDARSTRSEEVTDSTSFISSFEVLESRVAGKRALHQNLLSCLILPNT